MLAMDYDRSLLNKGWLSDKGIEKFPNRLNTPVQDLFVDETKTTIISPEEIIKL